jgi:hypothetical protein
MFDPAYVLVSLDALAQYSALLRQSGALDKAFQT